MVACRQFACAAALPAGLQRCWKWIVTLALAVVYVVVWGNVHSYPLLFGPLQDEFHTSATETGWICSVTIGVNSLVSPLAAYLERRFGFRVTVCMGVVLSASGVFASSFVPQLFYLYFTYGVVYGIGINFTYHASLCLMVQYFPKKNCRRATSIIMCGGTTGMLLFSPFIEMLIRAVTWRGALRISSSIVLCIGLPFALMCKSPEEKAKDREKAEQKADKKALKCGEDDEERRCKIKHYLKKVHPQEEKEDKMAWNCDEPMEKTKLWQCEEQCNGHVVSKSEEQCNGHIVSKSEEQCNGHVVSKSEEQCNGHVVSKCDEKLDEKSEAVPEEDKNIPCAEISSDFKKWKCILNSIRCWTFITAIFISAFSWSFYWVNMVSYLSTVGLSQWQGAIILTTSAASELTAKIVLAVIGDRLPCSNVSLLVFHGIITSVFTVGLMFITNFVGAVGVVVGVGMMRGVYQVVPYMSCVEVIGARWGDEAQTLTLVVQGVGYLIGALPSGAIYDITDSYHTCLMMIIGLFLLSAVALFILKLSDRFCKWQKRTKSSEAVAVVTLPFIPQKDNVIIYDMVTTV